MFKPLCTFNVCQVVTLRDEGFSLTKREQLKLKPRSSAVCIQTLPLKTVIYRWFKRSQKLTKVTHETFSCYEDTVRRVLEKHGVFQEMLQKISSKKKQMFLFKNDVTICSRRVSLSDIMLLLLMKTNN